MYLSYEDLSLVSELIQQFLDFSKLLLKQGYFFYNGIVTLLEGDCWVHQRIPLFPIIFSLQGELLELFADLTIGASEFVDFSLIELNVIGSSFLQVLQFVGETIDLIVFFC